MKAIPKYLTKVRVGSKLSQTFHDQTRFRTGPAMKTLWPHKSFVDMVADCELIMSDFCFFLTAIEATPVWDRKGFFECIGLNEEESERYTFCSSTEQRESVVEDVVEKRRKERHGRGT